MSNIPSFLEAFVAVLWAAGFVGSPYDIVKIGSLHLWAVCVLEDGVACDIVKIGSLHS